MKSHPNDGEEIVNHKLINSNRPERMTLFQWIRTTKRWWKIFQKLLSRLLELNKTQNSMKCERNFTFHRWLVRLVWVMFVSHQWLTVHILIVDFATHFVWMHSSLVHTVDVYLCDVIQCECHKNACQLRAQAMWWKDPASFAVCVVRILIACVAILTT